MASDESEMTREEAKRILRRLELDAYSSIVTAFRAQGDLNKKKKEILQDLSSHLSISTERHRAEVRRAVNDDRLNSIAECMHGPATSTEWSIEGRRLVSLMPRLVPQTVFTAKATLTANKTTTENSELPQRKAPSHPVVKIQESDKPKKKKKLNPGNIKLTTNNKHLTSKPEYKSFPTSPNKLNLTSPPTTPKLPSSLVKSPVKFHPKPLILQRSPQKGSGNLKAPSISMQSSSANTASFNSSTFNISSSMQFSSFTNTLKLESPTGSPVGPVNQFTSLLQSPKLICSSQSPSESSFSMMGSSTGPLIHKMRFKPPAPRQKTAKPTKFKPMGPSLLSSPKPLGPSLSLSSQKLLGLASSQKAVTSTSSSSSAVNILGVPINQMSPVRSQPPSITVVTGPSPSSKIIQVHKTSPPANSSIYTSVGSLSKPVAVVSATTTTTKTAGQRVLALGNVPVSGSQQLKIASIPNVLQQSGTLGSGAKIVSLTKSMPMTTGFKMIAVTTVVPGSTQVKTVYIATPIMPVANIRGANTIVTPSCAAGLLPGAKGYTQGVAASVANIRGGNTIVTPSCAAGLIKPTAIGSKSLKPMPTSVISNIQPTITNITSTVHSTTSTIAITTSSVIMATKITSSNASTMDKNVKITQGKPQITSYRTVGDSWFIAEASTFPSSALTNTLSSAKSPKLSPIQSSPSLVKNVIVKPSSAVKSSSAVNSEVIHKNKNAVSPSVVRKEIIIPKESVTSSQGIIRHATQNNSTASSSTSQSSEKRVDEEDVILLAGEKFIADLAAKFSRQNSDQEKSSVNSNDKNTLCERSNSIDLLASETLDIDEEESVKDSHTRKSSEIIITKPNTIKGDGNKIVLPHSLSGTKSEKLCGATGFKNVEICKKTTKTSTPMPNVLNTGNAAINIPSHRDLKLTHFRNNKSPEKLLKLPLSSTLITNRVPPSFNQSSIDSKPNQDDKLANRPSFLGELYVKDIVKITECEKDKITAPVTIAKVSSSSSVRTHAYTTKSSVFQSFLDSSPSLSGAVKVRSPEPNNTSSFNSYNISHKTELKPMSVHALAAQKETINDLKLLPAHVVVTSTSKLKTSPSSGSTIVKSDLKFNPHSQSRNTGGDRKSPLKFYTNDTSPAVIVQRIGFDAVSRGSSRDNFNTNYNSQLSGYQLSGLSNPQSYSKNIIGLSSNQEATSNQGALPGSNSVSSSSRTDISKMPEIPSPRKRKIGNTPPGNNIGSSPPRIPQGWIRSGLVLLQRVSRFRGPNRQKGEMNAASWFTRPVDSEDAPGYYKIVKKPMDFSTIKKKLEDGNYIDHKDFYSDMRLVKTNCYLYNPPGHAARKDCDSVFEFFEIEYKKVFERWDKCHMSPPTKKQKLPFPSSEGLHALDEQ